MIDSLTLVHAVKQLTRFFHPLLGVLLLLMLAGATRRREIGKRAWLAALLGITVVYLLHYLDHRFDWWPRLGLDYSTHSALAAALLFPLWWLRRPSRAWPLAAGVLALYEILIVAIGFHTFGDVVSTLLVMFSSLALIFFALRVRVLPSTGFASRDVGNRNTQALECADAQETQRSK